MEKLNNYDGFTKENIKSIIQIGLKFMIILIEYQYISLLNALLNLIKQQNGYNYDIIDKIHLTLRIQIKRNINMKIHFEEREDAKAFIEY